MSGTKTFQCQICGQETIRWVSARYCEDCAEKVVRPLPSRDFTARPWAILREDEAQYIARALTGNALHASDPLDLFPSPSAFDEDRRGWRSFWTDNYCATTDPNRDRIDWQGPPPGDCPCSGCR